MKSILKSRCFRETSNAYRIVVLTFSVFLSAPFLASCAEKTGSNPAGPLDLDRADLVQNGCLDLQKAMSQFSRFPKEIRVQRHTSDFTMEPFTLENLSVRQNFAAIAAFSQYVHETKTPSEFLRDFGRVRQTQCEILEIGNDLEGYQLFEISTEPGEFDLLMRRIKQTTDSETESVAETDGFELGVTLKGPREMELRTAHVIMDPCPPYPKVKSAHVQRIRWGKPSQIENELRTVSKTLIETLSASLLDMPQSLKEQAVYETTEVISVAASELQKLAESTLDPAVHKCPYRATPPSGEEPPAPANGSAPPRTNPQPPTPPPSAPPISPPPVEADPILPDPEEPDPEDETVIP
jgi:hypothetical protein